MVVLGVDPGRARIGLAISDDEERMAFPLATVADAQEVSRWADERGAGRVVVGLPLKLDGTEGEAARRARELGAQIGEATGLTVEFFDERLSTVSAVRSLRTLGVNAKSSKDVVDQSAAAIMLQTYLDAAQR